MLDRNGARPPRISQWNISLQRAVTPNLLVEAAWVGNRGVWEQANVLDNYNAITPARLASFGLNVNSATDQALLSKTFSSGLPQQRGFQVPYASFPVGQTLEQALRPYPQFSSSLTPTWAPLGNSWYDALQVKATQRLWRGLSGSVAFTWQKELALGATVQDGSGGSINDAFNRQVNKDISSFSQPFVFVPAFNYEVARVWLAQDGNKSPAKAGRSAASSVTQAVCPYRYRPPTTRSASVLEQGTFVNRVPGAAAFPERPELPLHRSE